METMQKYVIVIAIIFAWLGPSLRSSADTIYLKNGNKIDGIISRETDEFVYIQMPLGNISLSKSAIESIQRSNVEDAEKIKEKWDRERKEKEQEQVERASFEEKQRAKGLVNYNGTWITPGKLAEIRQREKEADAGHSREIEMAALQKEMELLKSQNSDLRQEIARLKDQLDVRSQEQIELSRQMLQKQKESLEFQKESEKRQIGQRPPHIWVAPRIDAFTPYPTPSE